jgi:hypothetical protein
MLVGGKVEQELVISNRNLCATVRVNRATSALIAHGARAHIYLSTCLSVCLSICLYRCDLPLFGHLLRTMYGMYAEICSILRM